MTSGKQGSNPPKEFICEFCGKYFYKIPYHEYRFCSRTCSNKVPTAHPKPKKSKFLRARYRPCSKCGEYINERKKDTIMCMKCFREKQQIESNPPELIEFIKQNFTNNGGKWISEHTGYSVGIVRRIAYRIGLIVSQKGKRQQYEAAKKRMTQNNPMFKQETRAKVAKYWENHPEERALVLEKLMEGHQRIQKSKPNKLELKLFGYLDQLGLEYEPYHLIKPKFIVDALVGDNIIVQADGDYWHGHPRFSKLTERQIAQQKRDKAQDAYLTKCGYKVIRIWENDMSIDVVRNRLKL